MQSNDIISMSREEYDSIFQAVEDLGELNSRRYHDIKLLRLALRSQGQICNLIVNFFRKLLNSLAFKQLTKKDNKPNLDELLTGLGVEKFVNQIPRLENIQNIISSELPSIKAVDKFIDLLQFMKSLSGKKREQIERMEGDADDDDDDTPETKEEAEAEVDKKDVQKAELHLSLTASSFSLDDLSQSEEGASSLPC